MGEVVLGDIHYGRRYLQRLEAVTADDCNVLPATTWWTIPFPPSPGAQAAAGDAARAAQDRRTAAGTAAA